jgi:hypothetical protein
VQVGAEFVSTYADFTIVLFSVETQESVVVILMDPFGRQHLWRASLTLRTWRASLAQSQSVNATSLGGFLEQGG